MSEAIITGAIPGGAASPHVERDPGLRTARGRALRVLLYLFEREAAIRLLGAG
ncbi:hypothetical protein AEGHOMDF_5049 [Methylobacterium soli]|uniref:hypothetical protein n=1 Tax=Methylobacterium soli TaxID=553447 RepID=UPI001EE16B56|nr:hypothetical protein [Methylobacterium soli]GJE45849.1 hypothetical protein AEGHOMDF_5049 [Methylobacterium soli]